MVDAPAVTPVGQVRARDRAGTAALFCTVLVATTAASCRCRSQHEEPETTPAPRQLEVVQPFAGYDFADGTWAAYLFVGSSELHQFAGSGVTPCMVMESAETLEHLKELRFERTGSDMGTPESFLVLAREGVPVRFDGLNVQADPPRDGLQHRPLGYLRAAPPGSFRMFLAQFKPLQGKVDLPGWRSFPVKGHECLVDGRR